MATDLERLDALLTKQERTLADAIRRYLRVVGSSAIVAEITALLEQGLVEDAVDLLESYVSRIGQALPTIWQEVGQRAADELADLLPGIALGIGFDVTNPRAAQLIRQARLNLIRDFSQSQREAVRQGLYRAANAGKGPADVARSFRQAIGLAPSQEAAVANYERLLRTNDRSALDRALRDRRFDDKVISAIERQRPLTERQIQTMVSRYRARLLIMRSETIARTEAHAAFSQARHEALEQMIEQTGIARERVRRIWHSIRDERTRDWHEIMQGQERGMEEPFVDGKGYRLLYPGDRSAPAETVINCRCTTTFRIAKAA